MQNGLTALFDDIYHFPFPVDLLSFTVCERTNHYDLPSRAHRPGEAGSANQACRQVSARRGA